MIHKQVNLPGAMPLIPRDDGVCSAILISDRDNIIYASQIPQLCNKREAETFYFKPVSGRTKNKGVKVSLQLSLPLANIKRKTSAQQSAYYACKEF